MCVCLVSFWDISDCLCPLPAIVKLHVNLLCVLSFICVQIFQQNVQTKAKTMYTYKVWFLNIWCWIHFFNLDLCVAYSVTCMWLKSDKEKEWSEGMMVAVSSHLSARERRLATSCVCNFITLSLGGSTGCSHTQTEDVPSPLNHTTILGQMMTKDWLLDQAAMKPRHGHTERITISWWNKTRLLLHKDLHHYRHRYRL